MAVLPGTRIVGTYTYNTETSPAITYKGFADYQIAAPMSISASVGGHTITTSNMNVSVWNHFKGNVADMIVLASGPFVLDGTTFPNGALGFQLASAPRNNRPLNSTKLPTALNVSDFDAGPTLNGGFLQRDGGSGGSMLQFTVDSVVVLQAIP